MVSKRHVLANKRATGRPQDIAGVARLEGLDCRATRAAKSSPSRGLAILDKLDAALKKGGAKQKRPGR